MNLYFYVKKLVAYGQGEQKKEEEEEEKKKKKKKKKKNASLLLGGVNGLVAVPLDLL